MILLPRLTRTVLSIKGNFPNSITVSTMDTNFRAFNTLCDKPSCKGQQRWKWSKARGEGKCFYQSFQSNRVDLVEICKEEPLQCTPEWPYLYSSQPTALLKPFKLFKKLLKTRTLQKLNLQRKKGGKVRKLEIHSTWILSRKGKSTSFLPHLHPDRNICGQKRNKEFMAWIRMQIRISFLERFSINWSCGILWSPKLAGRHEDS